MSELETDALKLSEPETGGKLDDFRRHHAWVRSYTLQLLDGLSEQEWFSVPPGTHTHIAWQVGHIAIGQYGLTLFRQRGRDLADTEFLPNRFRKKFMKGTLPGTDPSDYPSRDEILAVLNGVNQRMLEELPSFDNADHLETPIDEPNAGFGNRLGALLFACDHEMLHAGQIGFLRRMLGKDPLR